MSAVEALKAARAAGMELALDGDDLAVSAALAPPTVVLDALSRHKAEILVLLRPGGDGWSSEDWQVYFDERAGVAEFDDGLPRAEAEARAFQCCVIEWLNRHPVRSPPGRCLGCGGNENTYDQLLPYGAEPTGHAWLHSRCWGAWHAYRKATAVAALSLTLGGRLMGKRSNFERREADFYETPRAAVLPLIPYLRGIHTFAEPCAGDGALVRHLEEFGLRCVYAGDIRAGQDQDALGLDSYGKADAIITNPPWSRDVLHRLITHFQNIAPTWLLLDADWKQTRQAAPYLPHCSDIVAIGRVKWIEGSKYTGKDNACWYKFDSRHTAGPVFHWRDQGTDQDSIRTLKRRICEQCGKAYEQWQRSSSRFCSPACKQQAYRKRLIVTPSVTALSVTPTVTPAPSDTASEEFRDVLHADVARFEAEGWDVTCLRRHTPR